MRHALSVAPRTEQHERRLEAVVGHDDVAGDLRHQDGGVRRECLGDETLGHGTARLRAVGGSDLDRGQQIGIVRAQLARREVEQAVAAVDEVDRRSFDKLLGAGKRMFDESAQHARFDLTDTVVSPSGVAIHTLVRSAAG